MYNKHTVYVCCNHAAGDLLLIAVFLVVYVRMWSTQPKHAMFAPQLNSNLLHQPTDTLNSYPSPVYPMLNFNWSPFLERILPTPKVTTGKVAPMEGVNWVVGNWDCSHCLCDQLMWYGPLCEHHGCSRVVLTRVFATFHRISPCCHPTHPSIS